MCLTKDETTSDNMAGCRIDTKAITRSTTKMHRIRWNIENYSQMPFGSRIVGPDFNLTKTYLCNIFFDNGITYLYIYIHNKSHGAVNVKCNLVLLDSDSKELYQENTGQVITLDGNSENRIAKVKRNRHLFSLKSDVLIIDCNLTVMGNITTAMSFSESGRELRDHLVNDLRMMFNDAIDSDFTLKVGNEIIHTHKALLRARCTYFKKMFEAEIKETTENSVSITDVSHPTMHKLVEFLYTGDFSEDCNGIQQISDLYFAADKYEVIALRALCADKLISMATDDNICQILKLAECHSDEDLKIRAMEFILYHFDEVEKSTTWKTLISSEVPLACDVLTFCFKRIR